MLGDVEIKFIDFEDDIKVIEGKKSKGEILMFEEEIIFVSKDIKIIELNEVVIVEKEKVFIVEGEFDSLKIVIKKKKDVYDVIEFLRVVVIMGVGLILVMVNVILSFGENRMLE